MAAPIPISRQMAWISVIPQLTVMAVIIGIFYLSGSRDYFLNGLITYMVISIGLRMIVPRDHRTGMRQVQAKDFSGAILSFEKSLAFFTKNAWIDKYRYLTLLSSSGLSYRDMALCNIAFCYSQIGEGEKAFGYYKRALDANPNNGLAIAAINVMNAANK